MVLDRVLRGVTAERFVHKLLRGEWGGLDYILCAASVLSQIGLLSVQRRAGFLLLRARVGRVLWIVVVVWHLVLVKQRLIRISRAAELLRG